VTSKIKFLVSGRLSQNKDFHPLEVNSRFLNFESAQKRMEEWLASVSDLAKAKPEAIIETEELPHLRDCLTCKKALFKDDIAYHVREGVFCYDCAVAQPNGFFDLL